MLNKTRRLNNGTYPLVMQVLHLRKKHLIYSGLYLYPEEFDPQTAQMVVCSRHYRLRKEIKEKNRAIKEFVTRVAHVMADLEQRGQPYTCDMVVELYRICNHTASLARYWQNKIDQYRKAGRFGIADAQQNTLHSVVAFAGSSLIGIDGVSPRFVKSYEQHLAARNLSPNTICYYMRNFKSIMNGIIREGFTPVDINALFDGIKTAPRKTVKRAITRQELRSLAQLCLDNEPSLAFARDLFMFSFYTRGMSFVDIAFLQRQNLLGSTLYYQRKKTKQQLRISVNQPILTLISRYTDASHYLFPIVFSKNREIAYKEYRSSLRRINKALKIIGNRLNLAIPLTTYVARHSWATQAKEQGFPVSVISEGLGHCSENITHIYLKNFEQSVLDHANDVISKLQ